MNISGGWSTRGRGARSYTYGTGTEGEHDGTKMFYTFTV